MTTAHGDTAGRVRGGRPNARDRAVRLFAVLGFLATLLIPVLTGGGSGDTVAPDMVIAPAQSSAVGDWAPMTVAER